MKTLSSRGGVAKFIAATIGSLLLLCLAPRAAQAASWSQVDFASQFVTAVHAAPSNSNTIYATSSGSTDATPRLLHVSLDDGKTWLNRSLPGALGDVAVDPTDDKTVYLASGGLYKSTDAGATWTRLNSIFQSMFKFVVVAPSDRNTVYAETANGLFIGSRDGGVSWTFLTAKAFSNGLVLVVDPKNPLSVWAGETGFLWHSTDGGVSWNLSTSAQLHTLGLAIDPVDTNVMYMTGNDHIWKSADGGVTWADFGHGYYPDPVHARQSGQIVVSPADHNTVYLADDGYFFKNDGAVWRSVAGGPWEKLDGFSENVFALGASTSALWIGARDGLYENEDLMPTQGPKIARPALVIPGILGSWNFGLGWMLDPFLHSYDNLISEMHDAGYKDGQTLFTFPYEWRDSVEVNADRLKAKIAGIKVQTGASSVDVVAHSMGGLVLRQYVEDNEYAGDVGKVVFMATPQRGAPAAYEGLEGGDIFFAKGLLGAIAKDYFAAEALVNGFTDTVDYVRERVSSAPELLPDYPYLTDLPGATLRPLSPDGYPTNPLLSSLNDSSRISLFNSRVESVLNLAADTGTGATAVGFQTSQLPDPSRHLWPHGKPDGFPGGGISFGSGDLAVPLSSASSNWPATVIYSDHAGIVNAGADKTIQYLTGAVPAQSSAPIPAITRLLIIQAHSPVRLSVTAPDGGKISDAGASAAVPGAFFTGAGGEFQLITIPNPAAGTYRVEAVGTGTGKYQIDSQIVDEDGDLQPNPSSVTGYTRPDSVTEMTTMISDGKPALLTSVDQAPPLSLLNLSGAKGQNGWFVSPTVTASLAASDTDSGVGRIEYELDGSSEWTQYGAPFLISGDDSHTLRYRSWDVAGNVEPIHSAPILIDSTKPLVSIKVPPIVLRTGVLAPETATADLQSGVSSQKLTLDGVALAGPISLTSLPLGSHLLKLTATDVAGNQNSSQQAFDLRVDLPVVQADLQRMISAKQIKSLGLQVVLLLKLDEAKLEYRKLRRKRYFDTLEDAKNIVRRASSKEITQQAQALLEEDLANLITTGEEGWLPPKKEHKKDKNTR